MFKLSNVTTTSTDNLFAHPTYNIKSSSFTTNQPTYYLTPITNTNNSINSISTITGTYTGSTLSGDDTITIPLASTIPFSSTLEYVSINNTVFQSQNLKLTANTQNTIDLYELQPGQFSYDVATNSVTIRTYPVFQLLPNTQIDALVKTNTKLKDDLVSSYPNVLTNYDVTGSINMSCNFNNHPQATITLVCNNSNKKAIRNYFQSHSKQFLLFSIPFRVGNYSEEILSDAQYTNGEVRVSVQLNGFYSYPLSKSVTIGKNKKNGTQQVATGTISASVTKAQSANAFQNNTSTTNPKKIKYSINDLCKKENVNISGKQLWLEVEGANTQETKVNLQSILNNEVRQVASYGVFSKLGGVKIHRWDSGGSTHVLNSEDIIDKVGYRVDVDELNREIDDDYLKNVVDGEVNNAPRNEPPLDNSEEDQTSKEPQYEYFNDDIETIFNPPNISEVSTPPENIKRIKSLDLNFDQSGEVKTQEIKTMSGSTVLSETLIKYGFAYTANECNFDFKEMLNSDPGAHWKEISRITKTYTYDDETGYLIEVRTTGWQLGRFAQETNDFETIVDGELGNALDESYIYKFRRIPVVGIHSYLLKQFRSFYTDLGNGIEQFVLWEETDKQGNIVTRYKRNPMYVEPMFVWREIEYYNAFAWTTNPDNFGLAEGEEKAPDLTTGENKKIIRTITVLKSKNTDTFVEGLESTLQDASDREDRYMTYTQTQTASDDNFRNFLAIGTTDISSGRPPEAYKKPLNVRPKEDGTKTIPKKKPPSDDDRIKKINEIRDRENAALQQSRTFGIKQLTLTTFFAPHIKEGDTVIVNWNNEKYKTRVNSVGHSLRILKKNELAGLTSLTLGVVDNSKYNSADIYKLPDDDDNGNNNSHKKPHLFIPFDRSYTLGGISAAFNLMGSTQNRGDFDGSDGT